ncbi:MAG: hypothetical protein ACTTKX_01375 [Treponema sp.]
MTVKKLTTAGVLLASFLILTFSSCKQGLISSPDLANITNSSSGITGEVDAPADVKASHGYLGEITVRWSAVNGAARYIVFSAGNPFAELERCGETKDNSTEFKLKESAGTTKYYAVKAVNFIGKESPMSGKVMGSSLAKPVITGITQSEDGTAATVQWWMDNCKEDTYKNSVVYEVFCYASDQKTQIGKPVIVNDGKTSAEITGLMPKTVYYYKVDASIKAEQKKLSSDKVDSKTVHRLIPDAPSDFAASKGTSKYGITLSFKLPEFVDVGAAGGTYERHPLYFKILRKEKALPDSAYETVADYLGTVKETDIPNGIYKFSSKAGNTVNAATTTAAAGKAELEVITSSDINAEIHSDYEDYISLSEVKFTDKNNIERGKQYSYKIQSYVDDTSGLVSSDKACVEDSGWQLPVPSFKFDAEYKKSSNPAKFEKITAAFKLDFTDFAESENYSFMITQKGVLKDLTPVPEESLLNTTSLSVLNSYKIDFTGTDLSAKAGYYLYPLYILPKGVEDKTKAYDSVTAAGTLTVTDDATATPQIETFTVEDGYADKFIIKWTYHTGCDYSLSWDNYKADGTKIEDGGGSLSKEELVFTPVSDGGTAEFIHPALSGECRKYTITAAAALTNDKTDNDVKKTLGKPSPEQIDMDYEKITVKWNAVQKADSYEVSAKYEGSTDELIVESGSDKNIEVTETSGVSTCVITKPQGFNDITKAGKPIVLSVKAKNAKGETVTELPVKLIGPALVNAEIDKTDINANSIAVKWKSVEGAKGYLIQRVRYNDTEFTQDKADTYYYDAENKKIMLNGENADSERVNINISGKTFTLKDIYKADGSNGTDPYKANQSKIPWGLPYGYAVLPVKAADDFTFKSDSFFETETGSKIEYTSKLEEVRGAAFGYGVETKASKSKDVINLEWKKPYYKEFNPSIYKRLAKTGSREAGSWALLTTLSKESVSYTYTPPKDEQCTAFEYAVRYNYYGAAPNFVPSYIERLADTKEDRAEYAYKSEADREQLNKGYVLATKLEASYGGEVLSDGSGYAKDDKYYSEKVSWSSWDEDERKILPDFAEIYIFNDDVSSEWKKLAALDLSTLEPQTPETHTDTLIEKVGTGLLLKPAKITEGSAATTDGILKVLRNAKHYYKIVLKRGEKEVQIGINRDIYACRQITDEELAKAAMLAFSYTFYIKQGGNADLSNVGSLLEYGSEQTLTSQNGGTAWFDKNHLPGWAGNYAYTYFEFKSYIPQMKAPSENEVSFLKLNVPKAKARVYSTIYPYIVIIGADSSEKGKDDKKTDIKIKVEPETAILYKNIPMDYSAELSIHCSGEWNKSSLGRVSIRRGDAVAKTLLNDSQNAEEIRKWIPFQLYHDNSEHFYIKDKNYGWWPQ